MSTCSRIFSRIYTRRGLRHCLSSVGRHAKAYRSGMSDDTRDPALFYMAFANNNCIFAIGISERINPIVKMMMKKIPLLLFCACLMGCASTMHIACNEPDIEIYIDDTNYGQPPIHLKVPYGATYVDASIRKNGVEVHQQRINFVNGQNYYEINLPQHLQRSESRKFHSTH